MNQFVKNCLRAGVCLCFFYASFLRASPPLRIFCCEIEKITRERGGEFRNLKLSHSAWNALGLIDQVVTLRAKMKEPFGPSLKKVIQCVDELLACGGPLPRNEILFNRCVRAVVMAAHKVREVAAHCEQPVELLDEQLLREKTGELVQVLLCELLVQDQRIDTAKIIRSAFLKQVSRQKNSLRIIKSTLFYSALIASAFALGMYWSRKAETVPQDPSPPPARVATASTQTEVEVFDHGEVEAMIGMAQQEFTDMYAQQQPAQRNVHDLFEQKTRHHDLPHVTQYSAGFRYVIDLDKEELTSLDGLERIEGVENVERIDISGNKLSELPANLAMIMPNLKRLNIRENHLKKVPACAYEFEHLKQIMIENCPFIETREELLRQKREWKQKGVKFIFE